MPNPQKVQAVAEIRARLEKSPAVILTQFSNLTVHDITSFRRDLAKDGLELHVVKNTLLGLAAKELGIEGLEPYLEGPIALLTGEGGDVVAPAKAITGFTRTHKTVFAKGGILHGAVVTDEHIRRLSTLPSRDVLLAQTVAGMASPLNRMAQLLAAPLSQLAYGLKALLDKEGSQAA